MADISKINGQNIKDKTARDNHDALVKEVNETIDAINEALEGLEYTLPVATSSALGGIKIGYTASGANLPVSVSSEKAYVALTKSAVTSALGYTPLKEADSALSATSENPVQNKVIDAEFKKLRNEISAITGSSIEPFFRTVVFSYLFSNESEALDVTSTKDKYGEVQWYSSDGKAVSVNLSKIGYAIELFDAVSASLQLHRADYTNVGDTVNLGSISNENGDKAVNYSTGPYTKNTTIIFSLLCTDDLGRKFSVDSVVKISFPIYYGAGERETDVISNGTKENIWSIKGATKTITIESTNKYIWFITTEKIDSVSSSGFYAGLVLYSEKNIGDIVYNCYRSTYRIVPGTYTFDIK